MGIHNLVDVKGGFKAIAEAGLPVTEYVCPSTLKEDTENFKKTELL